MFAQTIRAQVYTFCLQHASVACPHIAQRILAQRLSKAKALFGTMKEQKVDTTEVLFRVSLAFAGGEVSEMDLCMSRRYPDNLEQEEIQMW